MTKVKTSRSDKPPKEVVNFLKKENYIISKFPGWLKTNWDKPENSAAPLWIAYAEPQSKHSGPPWYLITVSHCEGTWIIYAFGRNYGKLYNLPDKKGYTEHHT